VFARKTARMNDADYEPVYDTVPCAIKEDVVFKVKVPKVNESCEF